MEGYYEIDIKNKPLHEGVALALTIMAHPKNKKYDAAFEQRYRETCNVLLRARFAADGSWGEELQKIRPEHAFVSEVRAAAMKKHLESELRTRHLAGVMAWPFLQAENGINPDLPPGLKRLSQNQMAEFIATETGISTAENVKGRVHRSGLEVLHLSVAFTCVIAIGRHCGVQNTPLANLISDAAIFRGLISMAQELERPVGRCNALAVSEDALVKIRIKN
jgi:hypothetical protein